MIIFAIMFAVVFYLTAYVCYCLLRIGVLELEEHEIEELDDLFQ